MRRRIATWAIGGVIVAVLLIGAALGAAWVSARPMAEARLSTALGRAVTIGAVSVEPSFGLTRIMGTCMAVGEAAGTAAAQAVAQGVSPGQIDVGHLRAALQSNGCFLNI